MKHKLILSGAVILIAFCLAFLFLRQNGQKHVSSEELPQTVLISPKVIEPRKEPAVSLPIQPKAAEAGLTEEADSGTVSEAVRQITDDSGSLGARARVVLLSKLSSRLNKADRARLYDYLVNGENNPRTDHIKNDILNVLRRQDSPPSELTRVMLDIFYDEDQSIVMRSYALQHMKPWYAEENVRDEAVKTAFYAALEERNELAGVALLALAALSEELPDEFDRIFVAKKAALIAADNQNSELARITALDVSSRLGDSTVLETARLIVREKNGNTMMNSAAFGIIGRMGDVSDLPLIEQALESGLAGERAARLAATKLTRNFK